MTPFLLLGGLDDMLTYDNCLTPEENVQMHNIVLKVAWRLTYCKGMKLSTKEYNGFCVLNGHIHPCNVPTGEVDKGQLCILRCGCINGGYLVGKYRWCYCGYDDEPLKPYYELSEYGIPVMRKRCVITANELGKQIIGRIEAVKKQKESQ